MDAVAAEPTAAGLAGLCASMMSSNVEQGRRRAAIQPRRRRSERQENYWRAIKTVGSFAGNTRVGDGKHRRMIDALDRQFERAGRKGADAHHDAAGRRCGLAAAMRCSGMVIGRSGSAGTGMMIMACMVMAHT